MFRLALVQMSSGRNLADNLRQMRASLETAVREKADLTVFPEMAYFLGSPEQNKQVAPRFDEVRGGFARWAKELRANFIAGSVREPSGERWFNTLLGFDADGREAVRYRKLFLFEAKLPDREYRESVECAPGDQLVTWDVAGVRVGMTICFDLRFPELYRALRKRGAQLMIVPSAFTVPTGRAHWEVLLRARAIENQCFVAAPAQTGAIGEGRHAWGHSLVVEPWGEVREDLGTEPGVRVVDIDFAEIERAETRVRAWACRREEILPIA